MDLHQRQQFDVLLQTATERFVTRLEERHRGPDAAAAFLRSDPAEAITATVGFVDAVFQDFLLDNTDGAAFVLAALPKRSIAAVRPALVASTTVHEALATLARGLFAEILLTKTLETLEQHAGYQAVQPPSP